MVERKPTAFVTRLKILCQQAVPRWQWRPRLLPQAKILTGIFACGGKSRHTRAITSPRRYLLPQVQSDPRQKMVFVAGPRQVGKTTLAKSLPGAGAGYLNWDVAEHRGRILRRELPPGKLRVFDGR